MNLLETFDSLLQQWRGVFSQERTFERARRLTFGLLSCLRMHLTSTAICAIAFGGVAANIIPATAATITIFNPLIISPR